MLLPTPSAEGLSPGALKLRDALSDGGAMFFRQLSETAESTDDAEMLLDLWELVWAGWVTNDTLAPLRALSGGVKGSSRPPRSTSAWAVDATPCGTSCRSGAVGSRSAALRGSN